MLIYSMLSSLCAHLLDVYFMTIFPPLYFVYRRYGHGWAVKREGEGNSSVHLLWHDVHPSLVCNDEKQ